jgi:hypothetical protein
LTETILAIHQEILRRPRIASGRTDPYGCSFPGSIAAKLSLLCSFLAPPHSWAAALLSSSIEKVVYIPRSSDQYSVFTSQKTTAKKNTRILKAVDPMVIGERRGVVGDGVGNNNNVISMGGGSLRRLLALISPSAAAANAPSRTEL